MGNLVEEFTVNCITGWDLDTIFRRCCTICQNSEVVHHISTIFLITSWHKYSGITKLIIMNIYFIFDMLLMIVTNRDLSQKIHTFLEAEILHYLLLQKSFNYLILYLNNSLLLLNNTPTKMYNKIAKSNGISKYSVDFSPNVYSISAR